MKSLAVRLRDQAEQCRGHSSPLYADLLEHAADDFESGGVVAEVLAGEETSTGGSVPGLRLLAALHRLVLVREAPELALYYPSVGGTAELAGAWRAAERVLRDHTAAVRSALSAPVQTNEVGRAAALLTGVLAAVGETGCTRIRLLEFGASAGLNLRFDQFRYECSGSGWGPPDSPLVLADPWVGDLPDLRRAFEVVERRGCDRAPQDPSTAAGRLTLTSYVWADQVARFERLRNALEVAARVPVVVEEAGAADWLLERLAERVENGVLTIVWHSVVMQYVAPVEQLRIGEVIEAAGALATPANPLCRLGYEPTRLAWNNFEFRLCAQVWPGAAAPRVLATGSGHGPPVRLA